jgi:Stage II sporulation protein E (SpoIIE)/PAS fold/GAF domain
MCSPADRANPSGFERTLNPVSSDALTPMGLMQSPVGVIMLDTELQIARVNEAAERLIGGPPATGWAGRRLGEVLPGMDAGLIERSLRRVLATGEPVFGLEVSSRGSDEPGGERFWSCLQFRIAGPDGEAAGVVCGMLEATEHTHNQQRLALVYEASARIGTTLDITRTAEELLDVAIARLADAGAVDLLATVIDGDQHAPHAQDQKMHLQRVAVRWPADRPAPPEYLRRVWSETNPARLYHQSLVAGAPVYLPAFGAMTREQLRELDSGTGLSRMLAARGAGAHSVMTLPLIARGAIMGIVVLYRLAGSRPFTSADLSLARDLVARAAVCIDNARHYTRERATALELQAGLLPRAIPEVPGLQLACRYVPAQTAAEVGGDWFDVIPLPRGRAALTVGDVTGHDVHAAALMGQLRTATRAFATLNLTPAQTLTRLDQLTADLTDDETSATCIYAVHDPATADWDIARAGHPPPALARPGRAAAFLDLPPGLPLGIGVADGGHYQTTRIHIPRHSTLVLYTDGLIESPAVDMDTAMACLARSLQATSTLPVSQACDTLLAALAPHPADDIAVLMART